MLCNLSSFAYVVSIFTTSVLILKFRSKLEKPFLFENFKASKHLDHFYPANFVTGYPFMTSHESSEFLSL